MDTKTAILTRRSIRRFRPTSIPGDVLTELVDLARHHASGGNTQPLRYAIVSKASLADAVFSQLKWAMYLPDFAIAPDQQPPAYIILLRDDTVCHNCQFDVGAAATTIMLAAQAQELSTCCLASFSSSQLAQVLSLEPHLVPELVIAIGHAAQESRAVAYENDHRYFETPDGALNVPKRTLSQVLAFTDTLD